jgi:flagellar M-ring protein FliF
VVRSTQTREENQVTAGNEGAVTVGNELPGANPQPNAGAPRDTSSKNEEIVNYEISRTTRTEVVEGGRLKRLSVAVLVDGLYGRSVSGNIEYQPRPQEELDRIAALVRTSIGFDAGRGDQIEVVNLRFAEAPPTIEVAEESFVTSLLNPSREDILRLIEIGVIALLTLIVLVAVVRPLVLKVIGPEAVKRGSPSAALALAGSTQTPDGEVPAQVRDSAAARMIELAKVNGQVQQQSLERIGELVKGNPVETVSVLRSWIHERS